MIIKISESVGFYTPRGAKILLALGFIPNARIKFYKIYFWCVGCKTQH